MNMRFFLMIVGVLLSGLPAAYAQQSYSLTNDHLTTLFTTNEHGLELSTFTFLGTHYLIPPEEQTEQMAAQNPLGSQLLLYSEHPLHAEAPLDMPRDVQPAPQEATSDSRLQMAFYAQNESFDIAYQVSLPENASVLSVTTTVTNRAEQAVTLYPTERTVFNAEFGISNMPNLDLRQYIPVPQTTAATSAIHFHVSAPTAEEFTLMTDASVWRTIFKNRDSRVSLEPGDDWIAVRYRRGKSSASVQYQYEKPVVNLEDKVISFTAFGDSVPDASGSLQMNDSDAFQMGCLWVHDRVTLQPGEQWSYTQHWTGTTVPVPVVDVDEGLMIYTPVQVSASENLFEIVGCMGSPVNGVARVYAYDEDGVRIGDSMLPIVDPRISFSSIQNDVTVDYPVYIACRVQFGGYTEEELARGDPVPWSDRVHRVRLVVLDEDDNVLKVLGEVTAPWPEIQ